MGRSVADANLALVFKPVRAAIGLCILAAGVWASFAVPLGERTFAEHVDAISQTREAKALAEGARSRVNPVLQEARDRVLGEHVEAPTYLPGESLEPVHANAPATPPSTAERPSLPGLSRIHI